MYGLKALIVNLLAAKGLTIIIDLICILRESPRNRPVATLFDVLILRNYGAIRLATTTCVKTS